MSFVIPTMKSWPTRWSGVRAANVSWAHDGAGVGVADGVALADGADPVGAGEPDPPGVGVSEDEHADTTVSASASAETRARMGCSTSLKT